MQANIPVLPDKVAHQASLSEEVQPYYSVAAGISTENGLLMRGSCMVIPSVLQPEILTKLNDGHLGITKCRAGARQAIWWPGLSKQLKVKVKSYSECRKHNLQRAELLISTQLPDLPWQKVGTDLFHWKNHQYPLF